MAKTEKGHIARWHPAQLPSHKLCSLRDIVEISRTLGNVSRVSRHQLLAELPVIAYKYEQERQELLEPPLSEQQSQFTKIRNAADELLRHLFAEGRGQQRSRPERFTRNGGQPATRSQGTTRNSLHSRIHPTLRDRAYIIKVPPV